jgi:hypothetical protein
MRSADKDNVYTGTDPADDLSADSASRLEFQFFFELERVRV